jgi:hypothetical protein
LLRPFSYIFHNILSPHTCSLYMITYISLF